MAPRTHLPLTILLLMLLFAGEALANKFVTISGGVASNSDDKIAMLKVIGFYAGIFFTVSGVGLLLAKKKMELSWAAPIIVILLGVGLMSVKYF